MSCPSALCRAPALSVLGPNALCVGARRSRAWPGALPTLSVSRPAVSDSEPGALSLSVSGPGGLSARPGVLSLVSAPGAFCVRARRSLCPGPAVFVSGLGVSVSGPGALPWLSCVGRRALTQRARAPHHLSGPRSPSSVSSHALACRLACHPSGPAGHLPRIRATYSGAGGVKGVRCVDQRVGDVPEKINPHPLFLNTGVLSVPLLTPRACLT